MHDPTPPQPMRGENDEPRALNPGEAPRRRAGARLQFGAFLVVLLLTPLVTLSAMGAVALVPSEARDLGASVQLDADKQPMMGATGSVVIRAPKGDSLRPGDGSDSVSIESPSRTLTARVFTAGEDAKRSVERILRMQRLGGTTLGDPVERTPTNSHFEHEYTVAVGADGARTLLIGVQGASVLTVLGPASGMRDIEAVYRLAEPVRASTEDDAS